MRPNPNRGRVYRRCGCRDSHGKQLGNRRPRLSNTRHGSWAYAVDMPSLNGNRRTRRRSGYASKTDASAALAKTLECERAGIHLDDTEAVAQYLTGWLQERSRTLKPNTVVRYRDYITKDLIPAFGAIRLERLTHEHIKQFVTSQLNAGRGTVTLRRCISTLSSALTHAVKQRRLPHNPARYTNLPEQPRRELVCWSTEQTVQFLDYCHRVDDPLTELYEVIIYTGMRKGEALGLHWADVDLDNRLLYVRDTLISVNNSRIM